MIGYILQIIGIIAIVWISVLLIAHIILYIVSKFAYNSTELNSVTRDTNIYGTPFNEWYIIPTISFHIEFNSKTYPTFTITWLKWMFDISYHFKTEREEEIEAEVRKQFNKNKQ